MFIYYSARQVRNRYYYKGPDFFVVRNVDGVKDRPCWIVWEEDGRFPNVISSFCRRSLRRRTSVLRNNCVSKRSRRRNISAAIPILAACRAGGLAGISLMNH